MDVFLSRSTLPDIAMLHRVLTRLRRRPSAPLPWEYERLATPEEIVNLTKMEMRRAA
jgi:hypothetical protein